MSQRSTEMTEQTVVDELPAYQEIQDFVEDDGCIKVDPTSRLSKTLLRTFGCPPAYQDTFAIPNDLITKPTTRPVRLNIVLQIVGSRGDVQPFIALGLQLKQYGHRVRLATHGKFEAFVRDNGLEFYAIGGDPEELMSYMVRNPGLIPSMQSLRAGEISQKRAMIAEMLNGCWDSCIKPDALTDAPFVADAIIANPPSFAHIHCAEALGVPLHIMFTMPWTMTKDFPHPLANIVNGKDASLSNYLSYIVVEWATWNGLSDVINNWRSSLSLAPVPMSEGPLLTTTLKIPHTYCWSPGLIAKPQDWPQHVSVAGFFFRDQPVYTPPPALVKFLEAGPPPIYIGFGSIVLKDAAHMSNILLEAVAKTGIRALISRGWSNLSGHEDPNVFWLDDCPHEWLFQHVAAVVHHGGAGTTACGLRFGKPTVVVPFFGDQAFWGGRVAAAGAGPTPIHHKALTASNLAAAIEFCKTQDVQDAAAVISHQIAEEDGVQAAVNRFHRALPTQQLQCDALPDRPAAWQLKLDKKTVKLSRTAVEMLLKYGAVKTKMLAVYQTDPKIIKNRRWDPLTGLTASSIATTVSITNAATGIFVEPYKSYQRSNKSSVSLRSSDNQDISSTKHSRVAGDMAIASSKSLGKFFTSYTKGALVDIPLAITEGFHNLPKLWGDEVKDHGKVHDWKSGGMVAGKSFLSIGEGFRDFVMMPVHGGKGEGALGVAKGVARGTASMLTKTASGSVGLVAYTGEGLSKSLYTLCHGSTRQTIAQARRDNGSYDLARASEEDKAKVVGWYLSIVPEVREAGVPNH